MMPQQNGHMPPEIAQALAQARQGQPQHQAAPPPLDVANSLLAPVDVTMNLRKETITDPGLTVPATCSAVPAEAMTPSGEVTKVVIFTVRTVCQTFSAFWDRERTRANVDWIRAFLTEEMPNIIMPPGVAESAPDLRRMILTLTFGGTNGAEGELSVELDAPHAATWADLLERALLALSGIELPGQR